MTRDRAVNAFCFAVPFRSKRNETDKKFRCVWLTKQLTVLYSICLWNETDNKIYQFRFVSFVRFVKKSTCCYIGIVEMNRLGLDIIDSKFSIVSLSLSSYPPARRSRFFRSSPI
jgi:hypothetical protein